jgi:hypothetical protein
MAGRRGRFVAALVAATLLLTSCIDFDDGGTILASPAATARATGVAFADVAARGVADPVVVTDDARLVRAAPCGTGCWQVQEKITLPGPAASVATGDLDGDGVDDVVVATTVGTLAYLGGPADGSRPAGLVADDSFVVDATTGGSTVVTADLDGDGDLDVGIRGTNLDPSWPVPQYVEVLGDGAGGVAPAVVRAEWPSAGAIATGPAVADIDGNGDEEVLFAVGHALVGTASLVAFGDDAVDDALSVEVGFVREVVAGDLDGDGRDDVATRSFAVSPSFPAVIDVRCSTGTTYGACDGGSAPLATGSFGSGGPMAIHDLDGDGRADLVVVDRDGDRISTWRGLGDGGFAQYQSGSRTDHATSDQPSELAIEPGPGRPDLLLGVDGDGAAVDVLVNVSTVP